jgi:hypothetical protein
MIISKTYAELSIRAGILCFAADDYLGGRLFITRGRLYAWTLTEELVAAWREEAINLGVPDEILQPTADELERFPMLIEQGIALQHQLDQRRENVH